MSRGENPEPDLARAEADVVRALALAPEVSYAWLRRGIVHTDRAIYAAGRGKDPLGHFRKGEEDLDRVLKQNPTYSEALVERARLHLARARFWERAGAARKATADREAARRDFGEGLRLNPMHARRRAELEEKYR